MNARTSRLGQALIQRGRVRVELSHIHEMWALASPELAGSLESRGELALSLQSLAESGQIVLPAGSWEQAPRPPLPKFVTVPGSRRVRRQRRWQTMPWHPTLAWVASLPALSDAQLEALSAIDRWLRHNNGTDLPLLPTRVRSAEIFGREKLLDGLMNSGLFGQGRLSLEVLRARQIGRASCRERV